MRARPAKRGIYHPDAVPQGRRLGGFFVSGRPQKAAAASKIFRPHEAAMADAFCACTCIAHGLCGCVFLWRGHSVQGMPPSMRHSARPAVLLYHAAAMAGARQWRRSRPGLPLFGHAGQAAVWVRGRAMDGRRALSARGRPPYARTGKPPAAGLNCCAGGIAFRQRKCAGRRGRVARAYSRDG